LSHFFEVAKVKLIELCALLQLQLNLLRLLWPYSVFLLPSFSHLLHEVTDRNIYSTQLNFASSRRYQRCCLFKNLPVWGKEGN